jgi:uncharacterized 2Fe-2S/4Fe-4S cluster protein (DUF4445 family)
VDATEFKVIFQPSGVQGRVAGGTTVREAARQLGVEIESLCGDAATCGKCRVLIETGRYDRMDVSSGMDHVTPMGPTEEAYLAKRQDAWRQSGVDVNRLRLACQARVCGGSRVRQLSTRLRLTPSRE